ncbi:MAG: uncharacterized protein A8A55_3405 [Amphiamblys sp. WSBS2006]|nr:MAG: uncharacterized protein A8A55_3405 [Amphiamblys sp. WSBS2006]
MESPGGIQDGTPGHTFLRLPAPSDEKEMGGKVDPLRNIAEVAPVPKKGDTQLADNYRGISLVLVGLKHLSGIVPRRLSSALEEGNFFSREQTGVFEAQHGGLFC